MVNHKTSENENEDEKMRTITRAKEMDECANWPRKGEREGTVTGEEIGPTERREEHEALITSRDISIIFLWPLFREIKFLTVSESMIASKVLAARLSIKSVQ